MGKECSWEQNLPDTQPLHRPGLGGGETTDIKPNCHGVALPFGYIILLFWASVSNVWMAVTARVTKQWEVVVYFQPKPIVWLIVRAHRGPLHFFLLFLCLIKHKSKPFRHYHHCPWYSAELLREWEAQSQPLPLRHFPPEVDICFSMYKWIFIYGRWQGQRTSHQTGMEQDIFVSHTHQRKLHFRGRHFSNSFIFAGLLLWEIESKESSASIQMGQVRAVCHLSFDQAAKSLGSVISPPGTGKVCDIPMSWTSVEEHDTQKNYHCFSLYYMLHKYFLWHFSFQPCEVDISLMSIWLKGKRLKEHMVWVTERWKQDQNPCLPNSRTHYRLHTRWCLHSEEER